MSSLTSPSAEHPVDADRENMQQMLDASLVAGLTHLKRAAEDDPGKTL